MLSPEALADALLSTYLAHGDNSTWSDKYAEDVQKRRKSANGALMYDRFLSDASIDLGLFPPQEPARVFVLLVAILTADIAPTRRDALVYYLVREHDAVQKTNYAAAYAAAVRLAPELKEETDGCWEIDHGEWASAAAHLGSSPLAAAAAEVLHKADIPPLHKARLVLNALRINGSIPANVADNRHQFELLLRATAETDGLGAAWEIARAVIDSTANSDSTADSLYGMLFSYCFSPPNPAALRELLALPLSTAEAERLERLALVPGSLERRAAAIAVDILLVKLIGHGKYVDAIRLDFRAAQHEASHAFDASPELRQRRKTLLDGAWAIIPAVQRNALLAESGGDENVDMDTDTAAKPPSAVQSPAVNVATAAASTSTAAASPRILPMSASLRSSVRSSPDSRLLRTSLNSSNDVRPRTSGSERLRSTPTASPSLRSSSPFVGWKRPGHQHALDTSRRGTPVWGSPVPKISTPDISAMDEALGAPVTEDAPQAQEPAVEQIEEPEAIEDAPMELVEAPKPRSRRAPRRAAQRASDAIRRVAAGQDIVFTDEPTISAIDNDLDGAERPQKTLAMSSSAPAEPDSAHDVGMDDEAGDVSIPGGFPEPPRRRTRQSMSHSVSMHVPQEKATQPLSRSTTQSSVEYPVGSLARLKALEDTAPIARRTRAAHAELESRGSQTSGGDNAGEDTAPAPTPSRRSRRSSARAKTPTTRSRRRM
ncbi:hypothetical protein MCUN1_001523 [Malassezia cuniculi]|uniref:ELYS-like domain-containing protein n=1 Tax=Malassezia cuniculi TaxID=948313 RepID=A0AAF0EU79_9BASI|nr:hypothetical protein MCUN1_001523 [Malassezia cuniculi]